MTVPGNQEKETNSCQEKIEEVDAHSRNRLVVEAGGWGVSFWVESWATMAHVCLVMSYGVSQDLV